MLYNVRGQLGEIRAGTTYTDTTDTSWNRGAIINHYSTGYGCWGASCNAADNNGNLKAQDYFIPTVDTPQPATGQYTIVSQQFDYDALNRLQDVHEGTSWKQQYSYDRFGNRKIDQTYTTGSGIPKPNYGVDYTTNRLTAPSGTSLSYDAAGNLTYDSTSGSQGDRVFDAENRMTSARGALTAAWQYYVYDGEGKRVKRQITSAETWQVYGIGGELLAEYASSGTQLTKEYGYRGGQLLITAAVASTGWGAPPTIHDNPLHAGVTTVESRHITELRDAINALRSHLGMSQYVWTTAANPGDWVTADPILEMRIAVDQALGPPAPSYTAGLAQNQPILAAHIQELRNRVLAAWNSGTGGVDVRWLIADQLGTPRIILDASGGFSTVTRHDYLPFGEELTAGSRAWDHGYTNSDVNRQKFTGYERDNETDLDYAHARYFSHGEGRFVSPDPGMAGADVMEPQSWNAYAYTLNDPINMTDASGMNYNVGNGASDPYLDHQYYVDGFQMSGRFANSFLNSGAAVEAPLSTTRWNPDANGGQGEYQHFQANQGKEPGWLNILGLSVTEVAYLQDPESGEMVFAGADGGFRPNWNVTIAGAGVVAGVGEFSNEVGKFWRAPGYGWYPKTFNGNGSTGGKLAVLSKARAFKLFGRLAFFVGFADSVHQLHNGNISRARFVYDTGFGALGTFGGAWGFGANVVYTGVDMTVGWQAVGDGYLRSPLGCHSAACGWQTQFGTMANK